MFCTKCGNLLDESDEFCSKCGTRIADKSKNFYNAENTINNNNSVKKSKPRIAKAIIIIMVIFILFFITIMMIGYDSMKNSTMNYNISQTNTNIILDAKKFYKDEENRGITQEELINLKGQPDSTEDWNYDKNGKSYLITNYYYPDGEEYKFNNNELVRITINRKIPYNNKEGILPMFGLKTEQNTIKKVDNGFALRYQNCGVYDFWVYDMDKSYINGVNISFNDLF